MADKNITDDEIAELTAAKEAAEAEAAKLKKELAEAKKGALTDEEKLNLPVYTCTTTCYWSNFRYVAGQKYNIAGTPPKEYFKALK